MVRPYVTDQCPAASVGVYIGHMQPPRPPAASDQAQGAGSAQQSSAADDALATRGSYYRLLALTVCAVSWYHTLLCSAIQMLSIIKLIPTIKQMAANRKGHGDASDDGNNRQTALYSLKIMTRLLSRADQTPFIQVPARLLSILNTVNADAPNNLPCLQLLGEVTAMFDAESLTVVKANVLLLMGELVSQLKISSLPHLPSAVPKLISILQQSDLLTR